LKTRYYTTKKKKEGHVLETLESSLANSGVLELIGLSMGKLGPAVSCTFPYF
jgi:hypothetical protein